MKKLLLSLALVLGGSGFVSAEYTDTNNLPVASTAENPVYYSIHPYCRGGVLTDVDGTLMHIPFTSAASMWRIEKADETGAFRIINAGTGKNLTKSGTTTDESLMYVIPNGVNNYGWAISATSTITSYSCIDANNNNQGCGTWQPSAGDWQGTTWIFKPIELAQGETPEAYAAKYCASSVAIPSAEGNDAYYVIASYDRGGYLTIVDGALKHEAMTTSSVWKVSAGTASNSLNLQNYADPTKYLTVAGVADTATDIYITPHVHGNLNGRPKLAICANAPNKMGIYSSGNCIDASNSDTGCGTWTPRAGDWHGTSWILYRVDPGADMTIDEWVAANAEIHTTESALMTKREEIADFRCYTLGIISALAHDGFMTSADFTSNANALPKLPADFTTDNADETRTALNSAIFAALTSSMSDKKVRIRNVRRDSNANFPDANYLTLMPSRNNSNILFGTTGYETAFNLMTLKCTDAAASQFNILNEASKLYVGAATVDFDGTSRSLVAAGNNPCTPTLMPSLNRITGNISYLFRVGERDMNMDQNSGKKGYLCTYQINDTGSNWKIELANAADELPHAAEIKASTETEKHYYYIKGNRYMTAPQNGSFVVTRGELSDESNTDNQLRRGNPNMGSLWYFTEAGTGANNQMTYYLHNAINDKAYTVTGNKMNGTEGQDATPLYINPVSTYATENNTPFTSPNGFCINTHADNANTTGDLTFFDQSNTGQNLTTANWSPAKQIAFKGEIPDSDNGIVFYFIELAEQEANDIISLYTNIGPYFKETLGAGFANATTLHEALPAVYPEPFAVTEIAGTTPAEINATIAAAKTDVNGPALADFYAQPAGKYFHFLSTQQNYYLGVDGDLAYGKEDATDLSAMWQIEPAETNGEFYLYNHGVDKYLGKNPLEASGPNHTHAPMTDRENAHVYKFNLNSISETNKARISNGVAEGAGNNKHCLFPSDTKEITIWGDGVATNHWLVSTSDLAEIEPVFDGSTLSFAAHTKNPTIAAHHKVIISKVGANEAGISTAADISGELTLDENNSADLTDAEAGNYMLSVPAGYFVTSDNKLSAPMNYQFTVANNGSITGIDEINADEAAANEYFDLQGRRMARPGRGIFIRNGKKVLVR